MPAYVIGEMEIHDPEQYEHYKAAVPATLEASGGRFLVRGGQFQSVLGTSRSRNVVIEFPSYQAALDCWNSTEYQAARAKQQGGAEMNLIVVEGYDGLQPG